MVVKSYDLIKREWVVDPDADLRVREDRPFTDRLSPPELPAMYNQQVVDGLKDEVEHWKRLYRQQLQVALELSNHIVDHTLKGEK